MKIKSTQKEFRKISDLFELCIKKEKLGDEIAEWINFVNCTPTIQFDSKDENTISVYQYEKQYGRRDYFKIEHFHSERDHINIYYFDSYFYIEDRCMDSNSLSITPKQKEFKYIKNLFELCMKKFREQKTISSYLQNQPLLNCAVDKLKKLCR